MEMDKMDKINLLKIIIILGVDSYMKTVIPFCLYGCRHCTTDLNCLRLQSKTDCYNKKAKCSNPREHNTGFPD